MYVNKKAQRMTPQPPTDSQRPTQARPPTMRAVVARRYGMPVKALLSLNGLSGSSVLKPGAVLRVED